MNFIKKNKKLVRASSEEDMIHLRAIKYGMNFPNGFMYEYFRKHYEDRTNDWKIVNEFFQEAYNNKNGGSSRTTPFVLLEKMGNGNADKSKYILSYEAYFNYLSFRNSKRAIWTAVTAILISVIIFSIGVLFKGNNTQTNPVDNSGAVKNEFVQNLNKESSSFVGEFKVARVVDGDTIEIGGGEKVRYIGIDAPEMALEGKPEECGAQKALEKNRELVSGKIVELRKDVSDRDKYGRLLRYIYVDGIFVNSELVRLGFAKMATYPPDVRYQDEISAAQTEAQKNKAGLWTACGQK